MWHIASISQQITNSLQRGLNITAISLSLQQTMQQQNIQAQPVTQEDQQAMSSAEAADPE
jgi:hypothetical protein